MADWKITDPLVAGAIKAGGLLSNILPQGFSTPVRVLDETLSGNKNAITEKDLTPEQLKFLKDIVDFKGGDKGSITYQDYLEYYAKNKDKRGINVAPGLFSLFDPYGQMQTTLGQFTFFKDPKKGLQIKDFYDFNNLQSQAGAMETAMGPYGAIREYAGRQIPEGSGRIVNINLTGLEPSIK
jgi:hypothetical protein